MKRKSGRFLPIAEARGTRPVGGATLKPQRIGLRRLFDAFWERHLGLAMAVPVDGHPDDGRGPWTAPRGLAAGAFLVGRRDWEKEYRAGLTLDPGANLAWVSKTAQLCYGRPETWRAKLVAQPQPAEAFVRTMAAADGHREVYGLVVGAWTGPLRRAR